MREHWIALQILLLVYLLFSIPACDKDEQDDTPVSISCRDRAVFSDHLQSEYILPWPAGHAYEVIQSYCNRSGSHRNQLAYDFAIPVGDVLIASRTGKVQVVREDLPDNGVAVNNSIHNHILIEHADGSTAFYAHLKQKSVLIEVGQAVQTGDTIAQSGNSGATGNTPHLHFGVYRTWPPVEGDDLPVNFRNCADALDHAGGLIVNQSYMALPY